MCLFVVWAQTKMGKLALLFSFPSSIAKNPPSPAIPTPKSFLLPIKHMYWQGAECRQEEGFHHYLDPGHQITAGVFPSLSQMASGGERGPLVGLKPTAHLCDCAHHEQHAKQACQET